MSQQSFYEDHFYSEWYSQGCPTNDDGTPILYEEELEENNHQDLVDQTFRDELGEGCRNFARFLLTFIVISILGAGILISLIVLMHKI